MFLIPIFTKCQFCELRWNKADFSGNCRNTKPPVILSFKYLNFDVIAYLPLQILSLSYPFTIQIGIVSVPRYLNISKIGKNLGLNHILDKIWTISITISWNRLGIGIKIS